VKRDDLTGLAMGGNKLRKLEYIVADALKQGATILVTTGAVQSNHARQTAAAARAVGLKCALVLTETGEHAESQGNFLIDQLLGAEVYILKRPRGHVPGPTDEAEIAEIVDRIRQRGDVPYNIPVGGTSAQGALGYVNAVLELEQQLIERDESPTWLYFAAGSRGTQAGIILGTKLYNAGYTPYGISVSAGEPEKTERVIRMVHEAAALLGSSIRITEKDVLTDHRYMGPEYGVPTPECLEAILLTAETEAILLDPSYTGKAMAGLIGNIRSGEVGPDQTTVFIHTGGAVALFAHAAELSAAIRSHHEAAP
jgi:D-cysteine desulfhydrase family pyridoxal phosphate-dependent enzyme